MNKTKKGALGAAGVGVVALAMFGGGTFALWSDSDKVTGNETKAGHLVLDLKGTDPISNVGLFGEAIAPGEHRTTDFFIASADLDGVPKASLSFILQNLVDKENGCSSDSEEAVDPTCGTSGDGEFVDQADVNVSYSNPTDPSIFNPLTKSCRDDKLSNHLTGSLADLQTSKTLADLEGGEGVCVRFDIGLPYTDANQNASQGDSATFDIQWDLTQSTPED